MILKHIAVFVALTLPCGRALIAQVTEDGSIFDTSRIKELVISEVYKNGYFKTYFAKDGENLVLVTDYRTTQLARSGSRVSGPFIFVGVRKVFYRGTQYEIPEYAVYDTQP